MCLIVQHSQLEVIFFGHKAITYQRIEKIDCKKCLELMTNMRIPQHHKKVKMSFQIFSLPLYII